MSPGGLAIELFKSVPFGKRALFCAKAGNIDEMFDKINWDLMDKRIDTTLGGPQVKKRRNKGSLVKEGASFSRNEGFFSRESRDFRACRGSQDSGKRRTIRPSLEIPAN